MTSLLVGGIVLAGGRGSRLGADKALLEIDGQRQVDRCVAALLRCCDRVVVARGPQPQIVGLDVDQVPDGEGLVGPLAGIDAGLRHLHEAGSPDGAVAVVAVDHLAPSSEALRFLATQLGDRLAAIPLGEDGRLQPLHAVWALAARAPVRAALLTGIASPTRALADLDHHAVAVARIPGNPARWLHNVNRPADLERWADRDDPSAAP